MTLNVDYRPQSLDEMVGNDAGIESLRTKLKCDDVPRSYLFTGPPGCGKTTLAYVIKEELGISDFDFHEYDAANTRGIDTIREIRANIDKAPMDGDRKLYLLDECFYGETLVETPSGKVPINNIKVGDAILNLHGEDKVEKVFVNKVGLNRVVQVKLSNGTSIFCSEDHRFFVNKKWIEAKMLADKNILCYDSNIVHDITLQKEHRDETKEIHMPRMQKRVVFKSPKPNLVYPLQRKNKNKAEEVQEMWGKISPKSLESSLVRSLQIKSKNALYILWERVYGDSGRWTQTLFNAMCGKMEKLTRKFQKGCIYKGKRKKYIKDKEAVFQYYKRKRTSKRVCPKNEKLTSGSKTKGQRQSQRNKKNKWYTTYLDWRTWWEWEINRTPKIISHCFGMADGSSNRFRQVGAWVPNKLQGGHSKSEVEIGFRSGWIRTQSHKTTSVGQKKGREAKRVRVESVTFYKRGSNDQSFSGVIGNKERNQGFIEFYDLQIKHNPSYVVHNCIVHNCHQVTGAAAEALLKMLENPPNHVIIVLCTSEPEKIKPNTLKAIRRRCYEMEVKSLTRGTVLKLLKEILEAEEVPDFPDPILKKIAGSCWGSPGQALSLLDSVIDMENEDEALEVIENLVVSEESIKKLCGILIDGRLSGLNKWEQIRVMIPKITGDPETIRYAICGYLNAVILNRPLSLPILETAAFFTDSFMYTGRVGLTVACALACGAGPEEDIPF